MELDWKQQHFNVGDRLLCKDKVFNAPETLRTVIGIKRNRFGRISYTVDPPITGNGRTNILREVQIEDVIRVVARVKYLKFDSLTACIES